METTVYGPLRNATGEETVILEFSESTAADARGVAATYPRAEPSLSDEAISLSDGDDVRTCMRVAVDGTRAGFEDPVSDDALVTVVLAVQDGSRG